MADEKDLKQAQTVFNGLCAMLDELGWHYDKHPQELSIKCRARGDDLPMDIHITVDRKRQLVTLLSAMPFAVPEDRRTALAVAISQANNGMVDGSFDFDYMSGVILFRMTSCYRESLIGKELFEYMLMCSCYTIDEYNDKLYDVTRNGMSIEEILEYIK